MDLLNLYMMIGVNSVVTIGLSAIVMTGMKSMIPETPIVTDGSKCSTCKSDWLDCECIEVENDGFNIDTYLND